ncbi:MAG TPA: dienelactone hydrolase family protein [Candidatus Saccharimonadales bacterium]|nr:dienelactone hydrolase family protein [Candidatus Saccharimonadales bacterium]
MEFGATTTEGHEVHGITVLPRRVGRLGGSFPLPVVVYMHGSGGTWLTDGTDLRQFAELGLAAVGFDYNQTNSRAFEVEFAAVLEYVRRQKWSDTNAIAWVGFSLGAQNTLHYLLKHPERRPKVYVRLAGGWMPELEDGNARREPRPTVLLVHGENDDIFPVSDAKRVAEWLRTNRASVTLNIMANHGHAFEADQPVVFRLVAEYCKAHLTPGQPLPEFPRLRSYPFLLCMSPAFAWAGLWIYWRRKSWSAPAQKVELTKFEVGWRITAVVLATLAVADTALHLVPLRMQVTERTLSIARKYLLAPKWHQDFETVAALPIWQGQRLETLLEHVNLANYTVNELVNWKVDDEIYREFVLSPVIVTGEHELNWRRELWENFYPRIRHENTTSDAAVIVVRFLRQRVTIARNYPKQAGVESMWNGHIVNPADFEIFYVAALRSVGVPARLNEQQKAEFWTGSHWESAPPPLAVTWAE